MAHGVDHDHGGVEGASQGYHGAHGDRRVIGTEGAQHAQVARTVSQLSQDQTTDLHTKYTL